MNLPRHSPHLQRATPKNNDLPTTNSLQIQSSKDMTQAIHQKTQNSRLTLIDPTNPTSITSKSTREAIIKTRQKIHNPALNGKIFWEHAFIFLVQIKCYLRTCRLFSFCKNRQILPANFRDFFSASKLRKSSAIVQFLKIFLEGVPKKSYNLSMFPNNLTI